MLPNIHQVLLDVAFVSFKATSCWETSTQNMLSHRIILNVCELAHLQGEGCSQSLLSNIALDEFANQILMGRRYVSKDFNGLLAMLMQIQLHPRVWKSTNVDIYGGGS